MKYINSSFTEEEHSKIVRAKEYIASKRNGNISWHDLLLYFAELVNKDIKVDGEHINEKY